LFNSSRVCNSRQLLNPGYMDCLEPLEGSESRARWGGDAAPEGSIRLSVGTEDADDIIEDIEQALSA